MNGYYWGMQPHLWSYDWRELQCACLLVRTVCSFMYLEWFSHCCRQRASCSRCRAICLSIDLTRLGQWAAVSVGKAMVLVADVSQVSTILLSQFYVARVVLHISINIDTSFQGLLMCITKQQLIWTLSCYESFQANWLAGKSKKSLYLLPGLCGWTKSSTNAS